MELIPGMDSRLLYLRRLEAELISNCRNKFNLIRLVATIYHGVLHPSCCTALANTLLILGGYHYAWSRYIKGSLYE
jgi:hypothetical protein